MGSAWRPVDISRRLTRRDLLITAGLAAVAAGGTTLAVGLGSRPNALAPAPVPSTGGAARGPTGSGDQVGSVGSSSTRISAFGGRLSWSQDGSRLAVDTTTPGGPHVIRVLEVPSFTTLAEISASSPFWNASGDAIVAIGPNRDVDAFVWTSASGQPRQFASGPVDAALWIGNVPAVVRGEQVSDAAGAVRTVCSATCVMRPAPAGDLAAIFLSSDTQSKPTITDLRTGRALRVIDAVDSRLLWSSATPTSVAWRAGRTLHSWRADGREATLETDGTLEPALVSPHGDLVLCAVATTQRWQVWSTVEGKLRAIELPALLSGSNVLTWSPDGRWLAASPTAGSILELFPLA